MGASFGVCLAVLYGFFCGILWAIRIGIFIQYKFLDISFGLTFLNVFI